MQILVWLPEREHREDAANAFEGEGACRRKRGKSRTGRKIPYRESLLGKLQVAGKEFWRWFRNDFIKKGTELILAA